MTISVHHSDCVEWLSKYDGPLFDSAVTDPPYHLTSIVKRFGKAGSAACKEGATGAYARASKGFMGKEWDGGDVAFRAETWRAVFDKLKPGAHLVAFSGTRTFHRMVCAIEDAGFEIRDTICWHYGSGFPKSHSMRSIDRPELGTALKPVDLMRWLCRLVTPPGGHILEPFAGSGTTGIAAMAEQMSCTMIEMEADHVADIERKLTILRGESAGLIEQHLNARRTEPVETLGGLFAA